MLKNETTSPAPLALSPVEAATALGVHRRKIFEAIRSGELSAHRIGAASRIWIADIEAWFRKLPLTKRKGSSNG
jgi:excisionase family DNA binding protein